MSSSNIGCAIMRLYEENILTILAYDNTDLIALYANKSWEFTTNRLLIQSLFLLSQIYPACVCAGVVFFKLNIILWAQSEFF